VGRGFGWRSFSGELKSALARAGITGDDTLLYLESHHFTLPGLLEGGPEGGSASKTTSGVLEAVDALLCAWDIPGLYTPDEFEGLVAPLKEAASELGGGVTPSALFRKRLSQHLRIVIAMDPSDPSTSSRLASFPSLLARCRVIALQDWGVESSRALASEFFSAAERELLLSSSSSSSPTADAGGGTTRGIIKAPPPNSSFSIAGQSQQLVSLALAMHGSASAAAESPHPPRTFVAFLAAFGSLLRSRWALLGEENSRLSQGLEKLTEAARSVDILEKEAGEQRLLLREKQAAADDAMTAITNALSAASERRHEASILSSKAAEAAEITRARKKVIETELADILPVLEAARTAVGGIERSNIEEIRSLKMPPPAIADVLSAVLILLGIDDISWLSMKKFLGGRGVIAEILGYDASKMSRDSREEVLRVMREKSESFKPEVIMRASIAAAPLAAWAKAVVKHSEVLEKVRPLSQELELASANLAQATGSLAQANAELSEVDKKVAALKREFATRTGEAESLRSRVSASEETISRAQSLLGQLSGEKERWVARQCALSDTLACLPVCALLASGFINYLGGKDEDSRSRVQDSWLGFAQEFCGVGEFRRNMVGGEGSQRVQFTRTNTSVIQILANEHSLGVWANQGLPNDALSLENGAVLTTFCHLASTGTRSPIRTPLLVDPVGAATAWVRKWLDETLSTAAAAAAAGGGYGDGSITVQDSREPTSGFSPTTPETVSVSDPRFPQTLELAVRFGKFLICTDCDGGIEPILLPLLRCEYRLAGGRTCVNVGEKVVDVSARFSLLLSARALPSHFPSDISAAVTLVNFTATRGGLQGQLLSTTLSLVAPDLESRRAALLATQERLKAEQRSCEATLLSTLAFSRGSLLENRELLAALGDSKTRARDIERTLESGREANETLERQRQSFAPLAAAGARLYFGLRSLILLCSMYDYGLSSFLRLFRAVLMDPSLSVAPVGTESTPSSSSSSSATSLRMETTLVPALVWRALAMVLRGCLKVDRGAAALHLVKVFVPGAFGTPSSSPTAPPGATLPSKEWAFFLGEAFSSPSSPSLATPSWLSKEKHPSLSALLSSLPQDCARGLDIDNEVAWGVWGTTHPTPELAWPNHVLPLTTPWQRLCILQALRPDRTSAALPIFVASTLGGGAGDSGLDPLAPAPATIATLLAESNPETPILYITTPGTDPLRELADFAKVEGRQLEEIAMGGGRGDETLSKIAAAVAAGHWVALKNLHLTTSWLPTLEASLRRIISGSNSSVAHTNFRLWLQGEVHHAWPPSLLQRSILVTVEAPPGMRANLSRSYETWGSYENIHPRLTPASAPLFARLTFLLAWLHGTLQERRSYLPQGWAQEYEFSQADLRAGVHLVQDIIEGAAGSEKSMAWASLLGLLECSVYGGRVDHSEDARILRALLATVMHWDVFSGKRPPADGAPLCPSSPVAGESSSVTFSQCVSLVKKLPTLDPPSLLGLPDNVHVAKSWLAHAELLRRLKLLRGGGEGSAAASAATIAVSSSGGGSLQTSVDVPALLSLISTLEMIMGSSGAAAAAAVAIMPPPTAGAGGGTFCPVSAVLSREFATCERLFSMVGEDLGSLKMQLMAVAVTSAVTTAASGTQAGRSPPTSSTITTISLNHRLRSLVLSLLADCTPDSWESAWMGTGGGAVDWLRAVSLRRSEVMKCSEALRSTGTTSGGGGGGGGGGMYSTPSLTYLMSSPLKLNSLFHPAALFAALRQASSRAYREGGYDAKSCSVSQLKLVTVAALAGSPPHATPLPPPELAALSSAAGGALLPLLVVGLRAQGAVWWSSTTTSNSNNNSSKTGSGGGGGGEGFTQPKADSPIFTPMPPLYFAWIPSSLPEPYASQSTLRIPLYASTQRSQLLLHVVLPVKAGGSESEGLGGKTWWSLSGAAVFT